MEFSNSTNSTDSADSAGSKQEIRKRKKEQKKREKLKNQCPFEFQKDTEILDITVDISKEEEEILEKMDNGITLSDKEIEIYKLFVLKSDPAEILKNDVKEYIKQFSEIHDKLSE